MWQLREVLEVARQWKCHVVWGGDVLRHDYEKGAIFAPNADTTVKKGQSVAVMSPKWRHLFSLLCVIGSNNGTGGAMLHTDEQNPFTFRMMLNRLEGF